MNMFINMFVVIMVAIAVQGLTDASPESRIHGGVDAPPGYAPHMVALLHGEARVRVVCGGSIVSRRHVLTAAHCVTPFIEDDQLSRSFNGRVGSNVWHSGGYLVHFRSHHIHPEWDEDIIKFDVAVLELTEKLTLSEEVAVIGLDFEWVDGDELSYVTGWGTTWPRFDENAVYLAPTPDLLQLLYFNTLSPEECYAAILEHPEWSARAPPLDSLLEICTFHSPRHGLCHGDSGGALVSLRTGRQIGTVSWGMPCAVGAPDFYTRIKAVKDFLWPILKTCPSFNP